MVGIKLIGDSFYFHVAYLFQRELKKMFRLAHFTLKIV